MSKKILIITSEYPNKVSTFITRDIDILVSDGYSVDLFALYPLNKNNWDFVPDEGKNLIRKKQLNVEHISYLYMFYSLFLFWNYVNFNFFKEVKEILRQSKGFGDSQYKKSFYTVLWTIALFQKTKSKKYSKVISYWGNYSGTAAYLFSKFNQNKIKFYTYLHAGVDLYRDRIYLFEKLKHAYKIITVCQFNKAFLKEHYPEKFDEIDKKIYIYHLPIKIKKSIKCEKQENQLIAVGRLDKKKGLDFLIKAASLLKDKKLNFKIKIIGDGPERSNLESLVKEYSLNKHIFFLGHLPYSEVEVNIANSIALVHSSPELGDAVPTVIKESMSLGTPVIGTNIAGIPELLDYGEAGLLVDAQSEKSIFSAIEKLLSDKILQNNLSLKGRSFALKKFNFDINSQELINIIGKD